MTNDVKVREGQVWEYDHNTKYGIEKVRNDVCRIRNLANNKSINENYALEEFGKTKWVLISDPTPDRECVECGEIKEIPEGDFLCDECRAKVMENKRLIAAIDDNLMIIGFKGNQDQLIFYDHTTEEVILSLYREDITASVLKVLKDFVNDQ